MNAPNDAPTRLGEDNKWQVQMGQQWVTCDTKDDAETIAGAAALWQEALDGRKGLAVAEVMERAAAVMAKYGLMSPLQSSLLAQSQVVRKTVAGNH